MATYDKFLDNASQGGGGRYDQFLDPEEGDFSRGLKQFGLGMKGAGGGLLALAGKAVGSDGLVGYGVDVFKGAETRAEELSRPTDSLAGIGSIGDAVDFAQRGLGLLIPSLITSIATGGIGALAGREIAKRGAAELASNFAKQQAMRTGAKVGGVTGATAGSVLPATGGIYPEALAEGVENPELRAIGGGLASGALDVLPILRAARQTGLIGQLAREAVPGSLLGKAGMAAREVGKQAGVESVTEGAQTLIERGAAGKALDSPEAIQDVLDSMAIGGLGGGTMGLPGAAMRIRQRPEQPLDVGPEQKVNTAAGDALRNREPTAFGMRPESTPGVVPPAEDILMPGGLPGDQPVNLAAGDALRAQESRLADLRERLDPNAGPISRALFDDMGLVNEFQQQAAATAALPAPGQPLSKIIPGQPQDDQGAAEAQANADRVQAARAAEEARQASLRDLEARIAAERAASAAEAAAAKEQAFQRAEQDRQAQRAIGERELARDATFTRAMEEATARPGFPVNNAIAEAFARRQAKSATAPVQQAPAVQTAVAEPAKPTLSPNLSPDAVPADAPAFLKGQARMMAASATKRGTPSDVVPHPVEPGKFAVVPRVQAAAPSAPADIAPAPIAAATPASVPEQQVAPQQPAAAPVAPAPTAIAQAAQPADQGAATPSPSGVAPAAPEASPDGAIRVPNWREASRLAKEKGEGWTYKSEDVTDAEGFNVREWWVVPPKKGMSLDEARAYVDRANVERPLGKSWDELERMQGGRINRRGLPAAAATPSSIAPAAEVAPTAPAAPVAQAVAPPAAPRVAPAKFDGAQWLKDTKRLGLSLDVDLARAGDAKDQWEAKFGGMTSGPQPTQTAAAEALAVQLSAKPSAPKGPPANAVRLRDQAAKIEERANESLGRDRNTNTARRARMASSAEGEARKEAQKAATMRRVADAIERGEAKKLANVTTASQVDTLEKIARRAQISFQQSSGMSYSDSQRDTDAGINARHIERATMPRLQTEVGDIRKAVEIMNKQPGQKRLAATLERKYGSDSGVQGGRTVSLDMETARAILAAFKSAKVRSGWLLEDRVAELDRLDRMGIKGDVDLREALSEFLNYRSDRPQEDPVKKAERALIGQKVGIDFFPTPKAVAERMVSEANIRPGMRVLEPSAGNGNIAEAIRAAGVAPDVAEISPQLRDVLTAKGFNIVANDFMDVSGQYDRIIMNPPFSNSKDIEHVRKAYDLLAPGGRVVAIVGEGAMSRGDEKATGFRSWLDEQGATTEKLPANTFQDKSLLATTGANARLVIIDKPAERISAAQPTPAKPAVHIEQGVAKPATQAVIQKVADKPTVDRKEALRIVDEVIAKAPQKVESRSDVSFGKIGPSGRNKAIEATHPNGARVKLVSVAGDKNGVWSVRGNGSSSTRDEIIRVTGLDNAKEAAERALSGAQVSGTAGGVREWTFGAAGRPDTDYVTIQIPGDGTFRVLNNRERLAEFRKKFETALKPGKPDKIRNEDSILYAKTEKVEPDAEDSPRLSTAEPTTAKGQQIRQWLADRPDVTVVDRQDELPTGGTPIKSGTRIDGMYDPATGKVYVVAENVPNEARARWVAAHEGGHKGFAALDKATNGEATKRLTMLRNNRTVREIAEKIGGERGTDGTVNLEEAIAEVIAANETGNFDAIARRYGVSAEQLSLTRNVVQRFMDWLRTWFQQRGATDADVKQLMRDILAESRQGGEGGARLSTAPGTIDVDGKQRPTTNSQGKPIARDDSSIRDFWRWFGDSKVVDAEGRPLVVYHGTAKDFTVFRPSNAQGQGAGIYFSDLASDVEEFADEEGGRTIPAYLRITNPFRGELPDSVRGDPSFDWGEFDEDGEYANRWIRKGGFDGIAELGANGLSGTEYVAFRPEQVKSAIGNAGTFDTTNPDIRYSTVSDAVDYLRAPKTTRGMTDAVLGLFKTHGTFNVLNKTVGTQFHKATKDPLFKRVFDAVQDQLSDVTHYAMEAETQAPDVLLPMKRFGDIGKAIKAMGGQYRKDIEAIAKPLFANIEGESGVQQRVFTPAELKADYGLTDKQVEMYQQYRAAIDTSLDRLGQTILMRMGRTLGMDVDSFKNTSMEETADELRSALNLRIKSAEDRVKAAQQEITRLDKQSPYSRGGKSLQVDEQGRIRQDFIITEKNLAPEEKRMADAESELAGLQQTLGELNTVATNIKKLQDSGYTPAMRFGQYAVTAYEGDQKQPAFFGLYESRMAANIQAAKLRRNNPAWDVQQGQIDPKAHELFQKVPPDLAELFGKFMGLEENDAFKQYVALAASSRSALKRQLERQGTAGFSEDALRVLAAFLTSNARAAATNVHGGEINDALVATRDSKRGDVMKEARELVDYVQNPKEEAPLLRGLMFAHFMGGSLAAGMVNMTQPVLMTAPHLAQYAKAGDLARIMSSAMKIGTTGKGASQSLSRAMDRAAEEGITDPHEIYHLMAEASGGAFGRSLAGRAFSRVWGSFFSASEAWNRRVTFAAAFQTAEQMTPETLRKAGFTNAYDFAKNAINETQGIYNKGNRPNWARGPIGATVFTFKQFSIAYIEWLSRLPMKQQILALSMLSMAAGLEGLPFVEDIQDIIDTVGQQLGFATNTKASVNRIASSLMGDGLSEFALHGFSAMPGVPLDVSSRLGLSNLIPGTRLLNPSAKDKGREIAEVVGAPGSFVMGAIKAGSDGQFTEAMPKAIKDIYKAIEMATTGEARDARGNKVANADAVDAFVKAIGFQPAQIAEKGRTAYMVQRDIDIQKRVESEIAGKWARGIADNDPEDVAEARERLQKWNADNPELPIRIGLAQIRQRVNEMQRTREERLIRRAPPEVRQRIAAELQ